MSIFHEKLRDPLLKDFFKKGAYTSVLLEAIKSYEHEIREKIKLDEDLSGNTLMIKAFSQDEGLLRFKYPKHTKSEASKISGIGFLSGGLFKSIRNPMAHEKKFNVSKDECLEILGLISYLFRRLDEMEKIE